MGGRGLKQTQLKKHKLELGVVSLKGLELVNFYHVCSCFHLCFSEDPYHPTQGPNPPDRVLQLVWPLGTGRQIGGLCAQIWVGPPWP